MFARIDKGVVAELFQPPKGVAIRDCFPPSLTWVDCGDTPDVAQGWLYDGAAFSPPPAPAPAAKPTRISPLAFIGRFTPAEQASIAQAAMANAQLFLWFNKLTAAQEVDLGDQETKDGLAALVSAGLLSADRAAAVLLP